LTPFHLLADSVPSTGQATLTSQPSTVAPTTQAEKKDPPFWGTQMFPLVIMVGLFLIISMKSKRKQEKKVLDMLSTLKRGDRIQTIGGIIGTVVEARETDVLVKVDETNNTKIRFARKAIHRVLDDEAVQADKDKK
jgi:preprotein translocase subunit YajC